MKVVITGVNGFVGSHLAEYCLSRGDVEVFGTYRWRSEQSNISGISGLELVEVELLDAASVLRLLRDVKPDRIFHLAGQSSVSSSMKAPSQTFDTNVTAQINLLEGIRALELDIAGFLIPGSCEEYGLVHPDEVPVTEMNQLRPLSPYAVSKVAQGLLGWQYFYTYGLPVVRTRSFHQGGPRRPESFLPSQFAKQLAEVEVGLQPPVIKVGNLDAVRDFTDVRDIVHAYWLALDSGEPGEVYNLGTGVGVRIGDMLDELIELSGSEVEVQLDPARMRPADAPVLICDPSKFQSRTGWQPEISRKQMLLDTLDHWRERVTRSG